MSHETVVVLDFGGQYKELIARRIREQEVYCEVRPYHISIGEIREKGYKGIILTGGPSSVNAEDALLPDPELFELGIPVLGICYGAQAMAQIGRAHV